MELDLLQGLVVAHAIPTFLFSSDNNLSVSGHYSSLSVDLRTYIRWDLVVSGHHVHVHPRINVPSLSQLAHDPASYTCPPRRHHRTNIRTHASRPDMHNSYGTLHHEHMILTCFCHPRARRILHSARFIVSFFLSL